MTVVATTVWAGPDSKIMDVRADDGDSVAVLPHGLGATPEIVLLTPIIDADTAQPQWVWSGKDATNVTLSKSTGEGTGGGSPTVRVVVKRPHSIGR